MTVLTFNCVDDRVDDISDGVKCVDGRPNVALESLHRRVHGLQGACASHVDVSRQVTPETIGGMEVECMMRCARCVRQSDFAARRTVKGAMSVSTVC